MDEILQQQRYASVNSARTIKLITKGRVSGLIHIVELRYCRIDGSFFVLAGSSRSDWALNALATGEAKARVGEIAYRVSVKAGTCLEKEKALESFRREYGHQVVGQWYKNASLCLKLVPIGPPETRGPIRGESQTFLNFHQWRDERNDYYKSVREAFDSASEEYDFTIGHNYINTWIRKRSINELVRITKKDDTLLEIGCGTGAEAIQVSKHVKGIIATDISDNMLEILKRKVRAKKLDRRIIPARSGAAEISTVRHLLPNGKVRVAYSFNGALNCEPRISRVPSELASIIEENGYFFCSIRNTLCLAEALAHTVALQFDKTALRKNQPTMVSVGGRDIPSYYFSPSSFVKVFKPFFTIKKIVGLPALLPPAYLNDYYLRTGLAKKLLEKLEHGLGSHFPLNRFGDQTLFVFQKL
jgi:SAM-dependent methyltransferase